MHVDSLLPRLVPMPQAIGMAAGMSSQTVARNTEIKSLARDQP